MGMKQKPLVTTQQNTVDPMVSDFQRYTLGNAKSILDPRFQRPEDYVAGFNGTQEAAFQGMKGQLGGITPGDVQSWMNPYVQNVVDTTTGRIQRQGDEALAAIRGRQAAGSAFGGTGARAALQAVKTQEGTQRQIAETTAGLMSQGYTQAQATALANEQLQNKALENVLGVGNQQQAQRQAELDAPLRNLQIAHGIMPQQFSSTSTTTQPNTSPSPLQQAIGLGLTVGGMATGIPGPVAGTGMLSDWWKRQAYGAMPASYG